jgi:putative membrane protein
MKRSEIGRLAKIDAIYGIAATTLLAAGLTLWFGGFAKPSIYYSNNWIFLTKIALVLTVALLSIKPTFFFLKQRKGNPEEKVTIPSSIFLLLRIELVLLAIIPLLAGLMSNGKGYFGK